ncbi:uncharacterized protein N7515_002355 [Penicillium bovifimosum]|uniref:Uncharacterized protein n=1 Tax=Penicillium bovifimosum TaxID=126998 RepID=A0A9W9L960_9EURO|nr:uncharacterized protein N7515_002355 [Penicillium bovifimosum]KAJ5143568.1 hypothetical protein N7515_002355 [Penicillium bovifimosum]
MLTGHVDSRPCLSNIAYDSKEADQLPAIPVLSIIHFTFHAGVNISESSQLASILWQKSWNVVSTIPGFQQLYWAPVDTASEDQQVIILIQWDSGHGWKIFQSSLGFSMMLGYIQNISNRCIQITLPVNLFNFDSVLEIVSFQFSDTQSTAQIDQKSGFRSKWETTISLYPSNVTTEPELIHCCGEWLEPDYPSEDQFFIGLLFWRSNTEVGDQGRLRQANFHNLGHHIADLVKDATGVVSACTNHLKKVSLESATPQQFDAFPTPIAMQFETNHPVFRTPVKPEYNVNDLTFSENKDQLHMESMRQARQTPPQRIAGGPAGGWCPMGTLSQHHLSQWQGYPTNPDMDWISFRAQLEDSRVAGLFEDLRRKLWRMGDCPHLFWGKEQENRGGSDRISLFIELEAAKRQEPETQTQFQQFIEEFSDRCGDAVHDLSHRRIVGPIPIFMGLCRDIDITVFHVSENELDQRSFEYAFSLFKRTTHQQQQIQSIHSPWSAIKALSQGWLSQERPIDNHNRSSSDQSEQTGTSQFVSVFGCEKEGAREEWCSDFVERAQTQYDLLGHIVDWLRTLSKCITIQSLRLENDDPWMIADKQAKRDRLPPQVPPSIFDTPWANDPQDGFWQVKRL